MNIESVALCVLVKLCNYVKWRTCVSVPMASNIRYCVETSKIDDIPIELVLLIRLI